MQLRTILLLSACAGCVDELATSETVAELSNGTPSSSNATNNAVVCVTRKPATRFDGSCCTGTLVSPNTVLTANHCVAGWRDGDDHQNKDGKWHLFRHGDWMTVRFGVDPNAPLREVRAYYHTTVNMLNKTAGTNHDDIGMIGLDEPVDVSLAIPRDIAFEDPGSMSSRNLFEYGYGGDNPRNYAAARNWRDGSTNSSLTANVYNIDLLNGAGIIGGDSGGPVLMDTTGGPVVGVNQGGGVGSGRGVRTFGHGEPGVKPDVSEWLQEQSDEQEWVHEGWVLSAAATGTGNLASSRSHNSSGGANTIERLGTGSYKVVFPGIATASGGNVQVSAFGSGSERCKVLTHTRAGFSASVYVLCHAATGAPADARFVAAYTGADHIKHQGVYFYANEPVVASYIPANLYSSVTITTTITRHSSGLYRFTLRDQGLDGIAQVTALGSDSGHCKASSVIGDVNGNPEVTVLCHDNAGNRADLRFMFSYESGRMTPGSYGTTGFGRAHLPDSTANYVASANFNLAPGTTSPWAGPNGGTGLSKMFFEDLHTYAPSSGVAFVMASGPGNAYCKPTDVGTFDWNTTTRGVRVTVACFGPSGVPVNSRYDALYLTHTP